MVGMDPPDAGIPDAGVVPGDATDLTDGGARPDGGMTPPDGAGCCDTRSDPPPIWLLVLVAGVTFRGRRRRGTKA
jgi:MYXO-CTERM domain-containing protein